jgi:ribonucleoside-diphosphate reductase alpha chain
MLSVSIRRLNLLSSQISEAPAVNETDFRFIELNNMITQRGADGFFQLDKDREAMEEYLRYVDAKTVKFNSDFERVVWLIENGYYEDIRKYYSDHFIIEALHQARSIDSRFCSFTQVSKLWEEYLLRSDDRQWFLEDYHLRNAITALSIARGNKARAMEYIREIGTRRLQPATPAYSNSGKARGGERVSCFLLTFDDTTNSIEYTLGCMAQLSRIGGGVAFDLSNIRASGDPVNGRKGTAKGVVGLAKQAEQKFFYYDQGGLRKGAGAGYLNCFHLDIIPFLDTKKVTADQNALLKHLSIGVIIPKKLYDLAEANQEFYAFSPYDIRKYYGMRMTDVDFDVYYDTFVNDERIRKKKIMNARDFLVKIAQIQIQSGYPYIFNITNANKRHALHRVGRILMTNLCTEIMQLQEVSEITDYNVEDIIRRDISCVLASLNITNVMESKSLADTVRVAMFLLSDVSDASDIVNAPGVRKANRELHSVGLGAMDLHGFLAKNHIAYESFEALDFARTFFMMMNYYSLDASSDVAKDRGKSFDGFELSTYYTGEYFEKYFINDYRPKTEKVAKLFEGMHIPTPEDWKKLAQKVKMQGLYNAYRLAIAPTQSISYVQNATSSVMPIQEVITKRSYAKSTTYYPAPHLTPQNQFYFKSAYNMDMRKLLDLIAVIQEHVDQGVSTTLYVPQDISTAELASYYVYANKLGLKSLYYTRNRRKNIEDELCVSCAV